MAARAVQPSAEVIRTQYNRDLVDRFTLGHAAVGVLLGLARAPFGVAVAVALGWEIVENPLKDALPGLFPHASHDTTANAVGDVAAMLAGWGLVQLLPKETDDGR